MTKEEVFIKDLKMLPKEDFENSSPPPSSSSSSSSSGKSDKFPRPLTPRPDCDSDSEYPSEEERRKSFYKALKEKEINEAWKENCAQYSPQSNHDNAEVKSEDDEYGKNENSKSEKESDNETKNINSESSPSTILSFVCKALNCFSSAVKPTSPKR